MKNMQKKSKFVDYDDENEYATSKSEKNRRRQQRNWKHAWMEYSHEAEEHDEFFK